MPACWILIGTGAIFQTSIPLRGFYHGSPDVPRGEDDAFSFTPQPQPGQVLQSKPGDRLGIVPGYRFTLRRVRHQVDQRIVILHPPLLIGADEQGRVKYHYTLVDLVADSAEGEAIAGDDAEAVAWFRLEDLPGLGLWSETERIILASRNIG